MALRCLEVLVPQWHQRGLEFLPYQVQTAERLIEHMGGQGILADEVGLGKTIEAGLITRELMARGQCRTVLVLCPSTLIRQWQREMREKFDLELAAEPEPEAMATAPMLILSIDAAKRPTQRQVLQRRFWDLVIVDEAHKLKNRQTQNHRLVAELRRHRLVLLSATPLQNDLTELYSLVSLVRPGLFGSFNAFWREFLLDRHTPKNPEALREVLGSVMIRHRRQELSGTDGPDLPPRHVSLLPLRLRPGERQLYDGVTWALQREYRLLRAADSGGTILPLILLQREVCSSAAAVSETLHAMGRSSLPWLGGDLQRLCGLAEAIAGEEQAKAAVLQALVGRVGERVLVFTEFRATQDYLGRNLLRLGLPVILFHGAQSAAERDLACRRFGAEPRAVMISTESGGQGLNLQRCHHLVNYDLPWNPMRIEQRIGRVHRIGQRHEVFIYNLYAENTIEQHLLELLDRKINLFRQVIGELDVILRRMERGGRRSLEGHIAEILWSSGTERELAFRFEELGRHFLRTRHLAQGADEVLRASGLRNSDVRTPHSRGPTPTPGAVGAARPLPQPPQPALDRPAPRNRGQRVQAVLPTVDWGRSPDRRPRPRTVG